MKSFIANNVELRLILTILGVAVGLNVIAMPVPSSRCASHNEDELPLDVVEGQPAAVLPCHSISNNSEEPVVWRHRDVDTGSWSYVNVRDRIMPRYRGRFKLHSRGDFGLVIENVSVTDNGCYVCIEDDGSGTRHFVRLNVLQIRDTSSQSAELLEPTEKTISAAQPSGLITWIVSTTASVTIAIIIVVLIVVLSMRVEMCVLLRRRIHQCACTESTESAADEMQNLTGRGVPECLYRNKHAEQNVMAVTVTDGRAYVIYSKSDKVRVYDRRDGATGKELKTIRVNGMRQPFDIVASGGGDPSLFIADHGARCVWQVSPKTGLASMFLPNATDSADGFRPDSLSIRGNRLLIMSSYKTLLLYSTTDGTLIRRIELPDTWDVRHAVETSLGNFVVCHWKPNHAVTEIDTAATCLRQYSDGLDHPYYLALTADDRVMVVDSKSSRVLMMDAQLEEMKELVGVDQLAEDYHPWQICFLEDERRLLVSSYTNGIAEFDLTGHLNAS